jgi:hypothetical protein
LRCEWAKSKARGDRWAEDVQLLVEEMCRVVSFLDWKANWWYQQQHIRTQIEADLADGIAAYAAKQAHINRSLARSFTARWYPLLIENHLPVKWPEGYNPGSMSVSVDITSDVDDLDDDLDDG